MQPVIIIISKQLDSQILIYAYESLACHIQESQLLSLLR